MADEFEVVEADDDIDWLPDEGIIETPEDELEETGEAIDEVGEEAAEW